MNGGSNQKQNLVDPIIQRTSISATGKITESQVPLSSLKKEAMDLSAGSNSPTTLFVTKEAAMKITEQAITTALDNAWTAMVDAKISNPGSAESRETNYQKSENSVVEKASAKTMSPKTKKSTKLEPSEEKVMNQKQAPGSRPGSSSHKKGNPKSTSPVADQTVLKEDSVPAPKQPGKANKRKTEVKSSPVIGAVKKSQQPNGMKRSASSPSPSSLKRKEKKAPEN